MCDMKTPTPAAPPAPPPILEQLAPKSATGMNRQDRKRQGMSRYKISKSNPSSSKQLGGIPNKTGV